MLPLRVQSGSKCGPPSTNQGWRPLEGKSTGMWAGLRQTGRRWNRSLRPNALRAWHMRKTCQATRDALRAARSMCQQTARRCANDYWIKLSQRIQADADFGNTGGMYACIKEATGPTITKSVPLKTKSGENITDKKEQMER